MTPLSRFTITGLHGFRDLDIPIEDNTLILVGENGSGKTTILRLLYAALTGHWSSLAPYTFTSLSLQIGANTYELPYADIKKYLTRADRKLLRRLPPTARRRFLSLRDLPQPAALHELERLSRRYDLPFPPLADEFLSQRTPPQPAPPPLDCTVLYLPTYRRIEHQLETILAGTDERAFLDRHRSPSRPARTNTPAFLELVEFGMTDVATSIANIRLELDQFARAHLNNLTSEYLDDILEEKYKAVNLRPILQATPDTVDRILARIPEPILSPPNKERLRAIVTRVQRGLNLALRSKLICHYFTKLMAFHDVLEARESMLTRFCEACNRYMTDKEFRYSTSEFAFNITRRDSSHASADIDLEDLSSGEKQLVSIFCQLYLSDQVTYLVLIDEPELSLSVPWQRKFLLDIHNGDFCDGLVAATHSPFIYDNSLQAYARALGEF